MQPRYRICFYREGSYMDDTQKQHERAVGDTFIPAFNKKHGTEYVFDQRGEEVPDLVYRYGNLPLGLEIVSCYYDNDDASARWQIARNLPNAPSGWSGVDFNKALIANINTAIHEKCTKDYGANCLLVIYISPDITTFKTFQALIPGIVIPQSHTFSGIYLVGYFGVNNDSTINHAIMELTPDSERA
jgi:hypothetical protein